MTTAKNRDVAAGPMPKPTAPPARSRGFRRRSKLFFWIAGVAAVIVAGRLVWMRVREHVAIRDDYRLTAADISITPPPPWIRADVKTQVIRDAGLTDAPLSILDDALVERLYRAFALHPWVAKVERVSKSHPAHVDVQLVYRRPVAMVQVPGGWYPVDVEGVLLPSDDFSPAEARAYPRLSGVESRPLGPTGTKWGDPVVAGGARIAAALEAAWSELELRAFAGSSRPPAATPPRRPCSN